MKLFSAFIVLLLLLNNCVFNKENHTINNDNYLSIWDYFKDKNFNPFERIEDSILNIKENDSLIVFDIIFDKGKTNITIIKSSKLGKNTDSLLFINNYLCDYNDFKYYSTSLEKTECELLFANLNYSNDFYYQKFKKNQCFLFSANIKEAIGSFSLRTIWFLVSISTDGYFVTIIDDFSGILRYNSFGDFNNDNFLDFIILKEINLNSVDSQERKWYYKTLLIKYNNNNDFFEDKLFSFSCGRYGENFQILSQ